MSTTILLLVLKTICFPPIWRYKRGLRDTYSFKIITTWDIILVGVVNLDFLLAKFHC